MQQPNKLWYLVMMKYYKESKRTRQLEYWEKSVGFSYTNQSVGQLWCKITGHEILCLFQTHTIIKRDKTKEEGFALILQFACLLCVRLIFYFVVNCTRKLGICLTMFSSVFTTPLEHNLIESINLPNLISKGEFLWGLRKRKEKK